MSNTNNFVTNITSDNYKNFYLIEDSDIEKGKDLAVDVINKLTDNGFTSKIKNNTFADLLVTDSDGKNFISIASIRESVPFFNTSPLESNFKFWIIKEAEKLTKEASNSLLKFVESPSENVIVFFVTSNKNLILDTISSRSEQIFSSNYEFNEVKKEIKTNSKYKELNELQLELFFDNFQDLEETFNDELVNKIKVFKTFFNFLWKKDEIGFIFSQNNLAEVVKSESDQQLFIDYIYFLIRNKNLSKLTSEESNYSGTLINSMVKLKNMLNNRINFKDSIGYIMISIFRSKQ